MAGVLAQRAQDLTAQLAFGTDLKSGFAAYGLAQARANQLVIIDKDNCPRWNPGAIESVDSSCIDSYFVPLGEGELDFTQQAAAQ